MSDSDELASKERRRRLIERLNEKEKLIGPHSSARGVQMSEEELAPRSRGRGRSTLPGEVGSRSRGCYELDQERLGNAENGEPPGNGSTEETASG